ncbi:891_t:CDS:2 [Ambispora leptoticha]|uniref:891_t:CDS:1 n=1 Tax=Ambispora leptoticha TaxID=144679 RepID=A0A9N9H2G3_9GLOM|nr:891_t:CDS:2 [Ambispora leptoticha]
MKQTKPITLSFVLLWVLLSIFSTLAIPTRDSNTFAVPLGVPNAKKSPNPPSYAILPVKTPAVPVGTPPKIVYLQVDTGSGSTIVLPPYNSSLSRTAKKEPANDTTLPFLGGLKISGHYVRDVFRIGSITIRDHKFLAGTNVSQEAPGNGILGLGIRTQIPDGETIGAPLLGIQLVKGGGGQILFGGIDYSKIIGSITYEKQSVEDQWIIPIKLAFTFGVELPKNSSIESNRPIESSALIDSGSTVVYVDNGLADAFYQTIPGYNISTDGYYTIPCDVEVSTLPVVKVIINNQEFPIPRADLVFEPTQNDPKQCVGGIQGGQPNPQLWILGDTFMQNYYLIFDRGEGQIGVAKRSDVKYDDH